MLHLLILVQAVQTSFQMEICIQLKRHRRPCTVYLLRCQIRKFISSIDVTGFRLLHPRENVIISDEKFGRLLNDYKTTSVCKGSDFRT